MVKIFPGLIGWLVGLSVHSFFSASISRVPTLCLACFGVRSKSSEQIRPSPCSHEAVHCLAGGEGENTLSSHH